MTTYTTIAAARSHHFRGLGWFPHAIGTTMYGKKRVRITFAEPGRRRKCHQTEKVDHASARSLAGARLGYASRCRSHAAWASRSVPSARRVSLVNQPRRLRLPAPARTLAIP